MIFSRKRYWYRIKVRYIKNYRVLASAHVLLGLKYQNDILEIRTIRTYAFKIVKKELTKALLCNGIIDINEVSYLGHFASKTEQPLKDVLVGLFGELARPYFFYMSDIKK